MKKIVLFSFLILFGVGVVSFSAPVLTIYTEDNGAPLNYLDNGKQAGLAVEAVEEVMKRLKVNYKIQFVPWARGYKMLETKPNVMLFSTTKTDQRAPLFKWVGPVARIKYALYGKKGRKFDIKSLEDAKNVKSIGTYRDDAREQFLKARGFKNLESITSNRLNVKKLMRDRIDLIASSNVGIISTAKSAGYSRSDLQEVVVFKTADLYMAFSKSTPDSVVDDWDKAFKSMYRDGTFKKLYRKWMPGERVPAPK